MAAGLLSRKADAFAALLDGTDTTGKAAAAAAKDPTLAQLASLTQRLSHVAPPSTAFKSSLRDQLISAAGGHAATGTAAAPAATAAHGAGGSAGSVGPAASPAATSTGAGTAGASTTLASIAKSAPLWMKLFSGITAVTIAGTGVGVGAHRALPGDLFYGIKKQVEAVQLDLASGAKDKATTQLSFAHARTDELQQLIKNDGIEPGKPVSKETAGHITKLLQDWAEEAGVGTTSLIQQIIALGSGPSTAAVSAELRKTLQSFTTQQFSQLGGLLSSIPTGSLQTLTVSALGYLQRVNAVLGGTTTSLIQKLPIPLSAIPGLAGVATQLNLPLGTGSTGSTGSTGTGVPVPVPTGGVRNPSAGPRPGSKLTLPSVVPSLPLTAPSTGPSAVVVPSPLRSLLPGVGKVAPSGILGNGTAKTGSGGTSSTGVGSVTNGVSSATTGVGKTVTGVVGTVTGGLKSSTGPALSLPSAVPTLPPLPKLPGLGLG